MASNAGYIEFKGLEGQVRTGCPNTPVYKSLYCQFHKPVMVQPQSHQDEDHLKTNNIKSSTGSDHEPVGLIIGKKSTRNSTFYQVYAYVFKAYVAKLHAYM